MIECASQILLLAFMEGLLSVDNALALAAMVSHLPEKQRKRALTYGIWGAFLFRIIAVFTASYIIKSMWIKVLGGSYLLYLGASHFVKDEEDATGLKELNPSGFWKTVVMVELTDIVFSIDSILAAVGISDDITIVIGGGVIGIILMRFAASLFIKLIERYPWLNHVAYILICTIGVKLLYETIHKMCIL